MAEVRATRVVFAASDSARGLLEAMPAPALVLNSYRQVVAANRRALTALGEETVDGILGRRPGEVLLCVHASDAADGCGAGPTCDVCGAVLAVSHAIATGNVCVEECRIRTHQVVDGGALDLEVFASALPVGGEQLVLVSLRDISAQKRRAVLERVFFHDVLNVTTGIHAIAELLVDGEPSPGEEEEYKQDLLQMVRQAHDEIVSYRQLLDAEKGSLAVNPQAASVPVLLESVAQLYRSHQVAAGRNLVIGQAPAEDVVVDATLVRRVLGNLVKNALEAVPEGATVTLSAYDLDDSIVLEVANPGVMPDHVRKQVFQRSFSTKAGEGRGIGTHSVKLITERYLGGTVGFTSEAPGGTVFTVTIPNRPPIPPRA
jgi:hypothetical protein